MPTSTPCVSSTTPGFELSRNLMTSSMPAQIQVPPMVHLTTHHPKAWASSSTLSESLNSSHGLATPPIQPISRHDTESARGSSEVPPPYVIEQGLPAYTAVQGLSKTATTIRYLFWFGFIFPPLWIIGASTLLFSAKAPSQSLPIAWISTKNGAQPEKALNWNTTEAIQVERLWARRCTWAMVILVCAVITTVAAILGEHDIGKRLSQT